MAKGKTKSKMGLRARREAAFRMFAQGATHEAIAKKLRVSRQTVTSYRKQYEAQLDAEAAANPRLLQDVLRNTVRSLRELDMIREDAWKRLEAKPRKVRAACDGCGEENTFEVDLPPGDQARVQYQNVLLKAGEQRAKLFGVMGVKQEVFVAITNVQIVQNRMLDWMGRNLCADDREALASFLETELAEYMPNTGNGPFGVLDVESYEVPVEE